MLAQSMPGHSPPLSPTPVLCLRHTHAACAHAAPQAQRDLERNLIQCDTLHGGLYFTFLRMLSPSQVLKVALHSQPYFPRIKVLVGAVHQWHAGAWAHHTLLNSSMAESKPPGPAV